MQLKSIAIVAGVFALGLAIPTPGSAQPLFDKVIVNLPYAVTLGDKTIQPGDYEIKEMPSQDNSRVLMFYGNDGTQFQTMAITIPAYEVQTPEKSTITLHHIGNNYYFDKVWVQGKNYGYEFPLPRNLRERQQEQTAAVTQTSTTPSQASVTPAPEPAPVAATEPAPTPAPVAVAPAPQPAPAEIAQNTPPPAENNNTANREEQLPHTSAGWLAMLLGGSSLSGLGLMLRRKA